jgi:hypothetical protein
MDQLMDNNVVRVIVHNTEEEYELEEKSRSKMSQVEYCKVDSFLKHFDFAVVIQFQDFELDTIQAFV